MAPSFRLRSSSGTSSSGSTSKRVPRPSHAFARAVRRVEGEVAWRQLVERHPAVRAREVFREHERLEVGGIILARDDLDLGHAFGELQGSLSERVGEPTLDARPAHQPVDDHLDGVVLVAGQPFAGGGAELHQLAVDPGPGDPCVASSLSRPSYSPLRPRTTGRAPGSACPPRAASTRSTICCGVWRVMTLPQLGQCGKPIARVESRRR